MAWFLRFPKITSEVLYAFTCMINFIVQDKFALTCEPMLESSKYKKWSSLAKAERNVMSATALACQIDFVLTTKV